MNQSESIFLCSNKIEGIASMIANNDWTAFISAMLLLAAAVGSYANQDTPVTDRGGHLGRGDKEGVSGRITDRQGHPVAGVFVHPRSLDEPAPAIPEIAIVSDDNGHYTWRLPPGKYELSASAIGYHGMVKPITIMAGQMTAADFILERALH